MAWMEQENRTRVYFVSDVHLDIKESPSERETRLLEVFKKVKEDASHLYIVGDLFDFWFEYKLAIPAAYLKILAALLDLTQSGVKIFYIPGNHDFWMRDYLTRQAGVELTDDFHDIEHFGKKILITHGDGIRKDDRGYRFIKRIFRNKLCIWLYSQLPVNFAYRLAMVTSKASRSYTEARDEIDSSDYIDFAREKMAGGYDAVVMGHVHKPEIIETDSGLYVNCGDFFGNYSYVQLDNDGFELKSLTF
ncbi:MAG: UDP-2,3-diacylglucosamine diphosphatase [candidate division Zixibacteria bacterium]